MENNQTKEKLLAEIERLKKELKKKKKYGLVWEDKPEDVVEMCKEKLPVLREVKGKEIITDKNKPVNLLIEGDNYHALSVLNYTHAGKIDVIYIDPPYNTGARDWKYNNDYVDSEDGFRHSKWINMMSSRLNLARKLLTGKGIIAIAVDHNELFNLGLLCDQIFREENRLGIVAVVHKSEGRNQEKFFGTSHEYMFFYAKNKKACDFQKIVLDDSVAASFDKEDEKGKFRLNNYIRTGGGDQNLKINKQHFFYPIYVSKELKDISLEKKTGYSKVLPITGSGQERTWKTTKETFQDRLEDGEILAQKDDGGNVQIYEKYREDQVIKTHWIDVRYHAIHHGTKVLENILGAKIFDFPKSLYLIFDTLKLTAKSDAIILDFFAGSGTTGHAVLELNKKDGGNRKFILCTNNENNIATDVSYPRIKKVIEGYKNLKKENIVGLGGNLKYFKTDFVDYKESTDRNKIKLTKEAVEMLCVKEGTFESVLDNDVFKIFKNHDHYTGIIFDQLAIEDFKKAVKGIKGKISVYIFSLGDDSFEDEFEDIKQKVKLSPIPEAILKVYRRIYK
ncbi:site-specific DNA-methyltransferase [bacterium]|nr:site-specific DNA-methyltransferase [bacterium]